jgi:phosphatidylinositol alpha 1,6-mannosyltransferase
MAKSLRVALFSDSFYELNGVGTLTREFVAFAARRGIDFCCVHSGRKTSSVTAGSVKTLELKRCPLSFPLDKDLYCDPFLSRYRNHVIRELKEFRPDLVHITGPGDFGVLGFWVSNLLRVPLAASWHTNLHEYSGRRIAKVLSGGPFALRDRAAKSAEHLSLLALTKFYRLAHFCLAPNRSMVDLLQDRTGRPAFLMKHGVDAERFSSRKRTHNGKFCIGWVGRLTPEKNVRAFVELEAQLLAAGERDFQMLLVGDGSEREWLRKRLSCAKMPGFLQGDELAGAFACMDVFVFPSITDTFGLVILEAMASGVPVVLNSTAGTRVGIRNGVEGFLSDNYLDGIIQLMRSAELRRGMSAAAEAFAQTQSWDGVFDHLYGTYEEALARPEVRRRMKPQ